MLTVSRVEADDRIRERVRLGETTRDAEIATAEDLELSRREYYTWDDYNEQLLRRLFTTDEEAQHYGAIGGFVITDRTLSEEIEDYRRDVDSKLRRLTSVVSRLELFDEPGLREEESQVAIAEELIRTLDAIAENQFNDDRELRRTVELNMKLAPTYTRLLGGVPEITLNYPPRVWWPRARNAAVQALGAAKSGHYVATSGSASVPTDSHRVFIVHGRDHGLKEAVARLTGKLGYEPVILHEQPSKGRTIIEKFEGE
jgi:predicted nucleotide-binding protein with TIR-like domain